MAYQSSDDTNRSIVRSVRRRPPLISFGCFNADPSRDLLPALYSTRHVMVIQQHLFSSGYKKHAGQN